MRGLHSRLTRYSVAAGVSSGGSRRTSPPFGTTWAAFRPAAQGVALPGPPPMFLQVRLKLCAPRLVHARFGGGPSVRAVRIVHGRIAVTKQGHPVHQSARTDDIGSGAVRSDTA